MDWKVGGYKWNKGFFIHLRGTSVCVILLWERQSRHSTGEKKVHLNGKVFHIIGKSTPPYPYPSLSSLASPECQPFSNKLEVYTSTYLGNLHHEAVETSSSCSIEAYPHPHTPFTCPITSSRHNKTLPPLLLTQTLINYNCLKLFQSWVNQNKNFPLVDNVSLFQYVFPCKWGNQSLKALTWSLLSCLILINCFLQVRTVLIPNCQNG